MKQLLCKSQVLQRELKKNLRRLRRSYKNALHKPNENNINEWLTDNFYLLEKEGLALLQELKFLKETSKGKKFPRLYEECVKLTSDGELPTEAMIINMMSSGDFTVREFDYLFVFLRTAVVNVACLSCNDDSEWAAEVFGSCVKSLREIGDIDFEKITEKSCDVEKILRDDPLGIYPQMDERTKRRCRFGVETIAKKENITEKEAAQSVIEKAENGKTECERHVGFYLLPKSPNAKRGRKYLILEIVFPLVVSVAFGILFRAWYLPFLLYLPAWESLRFLIEELSLRGVSPKPLPRLEIGNEVPENGRTAVVVSTLLPKAENINKLSSHLEQLYNTNGAGAVQFCLLADLRNASKPTMPQDETDIAAAVRMIKSLNEKCGNSFLLAVRPRSFSKTQNEYTGWERKRGAITEFIRLIKGDDVHFEALYGDVNYLKKTKYLLALDSDTNLDMDSVLLLVSAALHPLNKPEISEDNIVTSGYGILCPRVGVDLQSAYKTNFSRAIAEDGGFIAYDTNAQERYQDLFGRSIFAGKGLIHVDSFYKILNYAFPAERVLSHDILEGSYLRAGFVSDVQVTDGFPKHQGAYLDRLHRWVRGDWQNITYIFKKNNPLPKIARYQLFDNLRRSITPVCAFFALLCALFLPPLPSAICLLFGVLSAAGAEWYSSLRSSVSGGFSMMSRLYYSRATPVAMASAVRGFVSLMMLPQTAFTCADAIIRALWRQFVSKKQLLQWVTSAQSDISESFTKSLVRYLPSLISGLVFCAFGRGLVAILGIIFLSNVVFGMVSGKERKSATPQSKLTWIKRDKLQGYAASLWRYYEEFVTVQEQYLVPDNVQETPVCRTAHRTSPTNIGFQLLSVLAARDFSFIDSRELYEHLDCIFKSIEKLEKYKGNLLNWYNTQNLEPLKPIYVSTVDSGNFLCSLITLEQGLREYSSEENRLYDIINRSEKIRKETDIAFLYNKRRKLFHIAFDVENEKLSPSFYDLLMSEARMTSYYAVATRAVPKKHWGALGRTLAREGRHIGPVSWTGTMFEYFMPHLLLPVFDNTMISEALSFCSSCQKNRVHGKKIPWGISESGFYAFDTQLNYQYKAHGVQKLGLRRGLNDELVISPYSSFLLLPYEPIPALRNLEKLEEMNMSGRCGFYEAMDFTPSRTQGQDYAVVRSYMAHHVGMSLISLCNALKNNKMQKRFMRNPEMASARSLLQERLPSGAVVFRDELQRETPKRPSRGETQPQYLSNPTPDSPQMQSYTNGEWTVFLTDSGASFSCYRTVQVTRRGEDLLRKPLGIFGVLNIENKKIPLNRALDWNSDTQWNAVFSETGAEFNVSNENINAVTTVTVDPVLPSEQRNIKIRNLQKRAVSGELTIYFEPSLVSKKEEEGHPAFSKLFTESVWDEQNKLLMFERRPRGNDKPLCLVAGILEQTDFTFETDRQKILKRPLGISSLLECDGEFKNHHGLGDIACGLKIPFTLSPRGEKEFTLFLSIASTRAEAVERALYVRREGKLKLSDGAPGPFTGGSPDDMIARTVLPQIFYPPREVYEYTSAAAENEHGVHTLWSLGISGDNPVVCVPVLSGDEEKIIPYIRFNRCLFRSGIFVDTAFVYEENEGYNTGVKRKIETLLKEEDCLQSENQKGGFFLINKRIVEPETIVTLMAFARYIAPGERNRLLLPALQFEKIKVLPCKNVSETEVDLSTPHGGFKEKSFLIQSPPDVPWCHVLANNEFGTLVGDSALGYTWAMNSRENKLTPWYNDPVYDNRGEMILLRVNNKIYDLTWGAEAEFSAEKAIWRGKGDCVQTNVTVAVHPRGMRKDLTVTLYHEAGENLEMELYYYTEPVIGVDRGQSRLLQSKIDGDTLIIKNPWNTAVPGVMSICSPKIDGTESLYCCDRTEFWRGEWDGERMLPLNDPCAAVGKRLILPSARTVRVRFILSFGATEKGALTLPKLDSRCLEKREERALTVETPDEAINYYVNTWLPAQVKQCRIFGRTGFYQCGGAYGFRDQLQDVFGVLPLYPELCKRQILRSARQQFKEGDVLHWYHLLPRTGAGLRGVRTRYSDDLLWLPFVTAEYVKTTGDKEILNIEVAFLEGEELKDDEAERYFEPKVSDEKGAVYDHCVRAVRRAMKFGSHDLPLIGGGDWNDGFNLVGKNGKGESVWLAEFFIIVLEKMIPLCLLMNDAETADEFKKVSRRLRLSVDREAWDGEWYLRAFYDDGTPMGGKDSDGCEIDVLPQSFAVLSNLENKERINKSLDSAVSKLVDFDNGIIRLFTPAFTGKEKNNPGYVSSYPAGVRENGGQYTHGAVWLCLALIRAGRADEGYNLLRLLNPALKGEKYEKEPYALAGDVSGASGFAGRGGWSLYTGAAGWYYYTVVHELLGITWEDGAIILNPHLPESMSGYKSVWNDRGAPVYIEVSNDFSPGMYVDGVCAEKFYPDGKMHEINYGLFPKN